MSDHALLELARAARLCVEWTDYRGTHHVVPVDTLRVLLQALELPAANEAQARDSLRRLRDDAAQRLPAIVVGRAGHPLRLPPALARQCRAGAQLCLETGEEQAVDCVGDDADGAALHGIDRPGWHRLRVGDVHVPVAIAPSPQQAAMQRRWALAVQLYALRRDGDLGLGDFSALAGCARVAAAHGADAVAISPVHALFSADPHHYSPYSPSSRLFLNVLHIDPAALAGSGWVERTLQSLGAEATRETLAGEAWVDWPRAARLKLALLRELWRGLDQLALGPELRSTYTAFCRNGGGALTDHARFEAIHAAQLAIDPSRWHWRGWPAELRDPDSKAVAEFAAAHAAEVDFHCFLQWLAARGLAEAQTVAENAGMRVGLIADLAVGTDSGGSHAWSRQADMLIGATIGAPPDEINSRGQNWGLSTFSPRALAAHGYAPFVEMLRANLRHAGGLRIDHILGMNRMWLVPDGARPTEGAYVGYPLHDLLNLIALEAWRHDALVVGEDLGTVPPGFRQQMAESGLLGMRVMYFERDHGYFVEPSRWSPHAIATTTTHDLPTVSGWWRGRDLDWQHRLDLLPPGSTLDEARAQRRRERVALWDAFRHAGVADGEVPDDGSASRAVDAALAFVAATPAPLAVVPVEDVLGVDEQPNLPGTTDQHPNWRRRLQAPLEPLFAADAARARLQRLQQERGRA